jgi:hypothetical protein
LSALVLLSLVEVVFLAITLLVYVTTYPPITIDNRMFSPAQTAGLWLIVLLLLLAAGRLEKKVWARQATALVLVALCAWFGWRSLRIVQQNAELGLGYNSVAWRQSETIAAVKRLPADQVIVSNESNGITYLTGRAAYPLAEIYQDEPQVVFKSYGQGDLSRDTAQRLFHEQGAALALFDSIQGQLADLYGARANERLISLTQGLRIGFKGSDGAIYFDH